MQMAALCKIVTEVGTTIIVKIIIKMIIIIIKSFPAHDELGMCRTSLVFPLQAKQICVDGDKRGHTFAWGSKRWMSLGMQEE